MQHGVVGYDKLFIWHVKWTDGWIDLSLSLSGRICNNCSGTSNGVVLVEAFNNNNHTKKFELHKNRHIWIDQM